MSPIPIGTVATFVWLAFDSPAQGGAPYVWHRCWALPQEKSARKAATGRLWNRITGCIEDHCRYSVQHNCTIDCIVPEHGCQDKCEQNGQEDYKYYVCPSGKLYDNCYPNGFPTDDPGCCTYFECGQGLGQGTCNPSSIRIQCEKEVRDGGNDALLGCMQNAKDIPCDTCDSIWGVFWGFLQDRDTLEYFPQGDRSVPVPDSSRRRQPPLPFGGGGGGHSPTPVPSPSTPAPSPSPTPSPSTLAPSPSPSPSPRPPAPRPGPSAGCTEGNTKCTDTRCCKEPELSCFKKNDNFAQCRKTCPDSWDCTVLTPGDPSPVPGPPAPSPSPRPSPSTFAPSPSPSPSPSPPAPRPGPSAGCTEGNTKCTDTRCCKEPELSCFKKNDNFAQCRKTCPDSWDCTVLTLGDPSPVPGPPAPSPSPRPSPSTFAPSPSPTPSPSSPAPSPGPSAGCTQGYNKCMDTRCCTEPELTCFKKNSNSATCRKNCPGSWDCTVLTRGGPAPSPSPGPPISPAPSPGSSAGCTEGYNECMDTRCCTEPELTCFRKNSNSATCRKNCPGSWDCTVLSLLVQGSNLTEVIEGAENSSSHGDKKSFRSNRPRR